MPTRQDGPDWEGAFLSHVAAQGLHGHSLRPELVELDSRLFVWARFAATFVDGTGKMNAVLDLYVDKTGHAQCRGLELRPEPGAPEISGEALHAFPLARMRDLAIRHAARRLDVGDDGLPVFTSGTAEDADRALGHVRAAKPPAHRRPRVTDDMLETVAEVYRDNPSRPTQAVAERFESDGRWISAATAARYVAKARERNFLGPAPGKGKSGELPINPTDKGTDR